MIQRGITYRYARSSQEFRQNFSGRCNFWANRKRRFSVLLIAILNSAQKNLWPTRENQCQSLSWFIVTRQWLPIKWHPSKTEFVKFRIFVCFYLALNWPLFSSQTRTKRNSAKKLTVFLNFVKLLVMWML